MSQEFVALVEQLVEFIGEDRTGDEIETWLREADGAGTVAGMSVSGYPDSEDPYAVTLDPVPDSRPAVALLKRRLGEPQVGFSGPDQPKELAFPAAMPTGAWSVVVVAWAERRGPDLADAAVVRVLLRRDPVD